METFARPGRVWRWAHSQSVGVTGRAVTVLVAAGTFLLAFENGGYSLETTSAIAVAVWWVLLVLAVLGGVLRLHWPAAATRTTVLLAAFSAWTLASVAWTHDAEAVYAQFARLALYVGLLVLVVLFARRELVGFWSDGVVVGIVAVAVLALASRFFPGAVGSNAGIPYIPALRSRLSYPIGYWNGLGILLGVGVPLVLAAALRARSRVAGSLLLAAVPLLCATIYLTSSRGAFTTAAIGVVVLVALAPRRHAVLSAIVLATAGAAAAVFVLSEKHALVEGLSSRRATDEARSAFAWLVAVCAVTAVAQYATAQRVPDWRPSRRVRRGGLVGVAVLVVAAVVVAHPVRRLHDFTQPPAAAAGLPSFAQSHLLSSSGSGRWQFWGAALHEFDSQPVLGGGAGSYADWWAQDGTLPISIRNAHSLYLETAAELGTVGLLLLAGFVVAALAVMIRAARRAVGEEALTGAALVAAVIAFLVGAGVDWVWQFPSIAGVAIACVGLAVALREEEPRRARPRVATLRLAAALAAACVVVAELLPLLTQARLHESQVAARRGKTAAALAAARAAVHLEPWASSPYLQLALVDEQAGALGAARTAIDQSIARDRKDWQLPYIAARIETELGAISAARLSYEKARALNPRSPLFASPRA
ncbi:MAG TPA: O-antigen ligase family protein [Gaiellaceae bacterium]|nr:O-antigen ligase family protein [Gaiellaceae bacterium]